MKRHARKSKDSFKEVPLEDFPDGIEDIVPDTAKNWSQPEDRGEDLINETDPFTQETEKEHQLQRESKKRERKP